MLDELDTLLAATQIEAARAPNLLSLKGQALLWDPTSTTSLGIAESPPSSPVQGTPMTMGTVALTVDDSPSPREAVAQWPRSPRRSW
jgi:hypothetical protein